MSKTSIQSKIRLLSFAIAFLGASIICPAQISTIVPFTQTWKFEQSNLDLGTAWKEIVFDDSGPGWGTGSAPLGFPANEGLTTSGLTIQTVLNRTTNGVQPRTYYFRTTFQFTNDPTGVVLIATNLIDDAAVFFLNGVELGRVAFPAAPSPVVFTTEGSRAASDINTYGYDVFTNTSPNLIQGVNTLAVEVHQTGNNSSDLAFGTRLMAIIPTPLTITQQPASITTVQNRGASLSVAVTGTSPQFQWYKGTNSPALILDATNATYLLPTAAPGDTGDYFVIATNNLNSVTSLVARITVNADTNGPVLVSARTDVSFQRVILTWDEIVGEGSAIEPSNYYMLDSLNNIIEITAVEWRGSNVVLTVPTMQVGETYRVEADFQFDLVGLSPLPQGVRINPDGDPDSYVQNTFRALVITPGLTLFQAYLNIPVGVPIAQFITTAAYSNSPSFSFYTNIINWPQSVPNLEQYNMRFTGYYVASETGLHRFDGSHDDDALLRIYPGTDPLATPSELNEAGTSAFGAGSTVDVNMTAGQMYYYEYIVREIGGGDTAGLSVILPSGPTNTPITSQFLAAPIEPTITNNMGIAVQPVNATNSENHTVTFSVTLTNSIGAAFQWQRNVGGGGFTDIPGAVSASYTTPPLVLANNGDQFRVIIFSPNRTNTSATAVSSVITDIVAPKVLAVSPTSLSAIRVTFDDFLSATATLGANYTLTDTNGLNPVVLGTPTLSADKLTVTIPTDPQTPGAFYRLRVQNVSDLAGNPVVTTNFFFQTFVIANGFAKFDFYLNNGGGTTLDALATDPNYPNNPSQIMYSNVFNWPQSSPDLNNYGLRISGFFIPPTSGNYTFYIINDDDSEIRMSTNDNPANASRIVFRACCNATLVDASISTTQTLVAAQPYYIEGVIKEGIGGDYLGIAFRAPGDATATLSLPFIRATNLAVLADPAVASIAISQQPTNVTIATGTNTVLRVVATGVYANGATSTVLYQWQRFSGTAFTNIPGATSATYTTPTLGAPDTGAQYRVLLTIAGASATSATATVTVGTTPSGPTLRMSQSGGALSFSWNAGSRLQYTTSLTPPINWQDVDTGGATNFTVNPSNEFNVNLDPIQAGGAGRTGSGRGIVTLSNNVLIVDVTYTNLSGNRSDDHFHAPAARGANAGVVYGLAGITTGTQSGAIRGNVTLVNNPTGAYQKTIAAQIQDIRNGLWYLNIHSSTFGNGEIRGQVEQGPRFYRLVSP